jgi:hypothetical protein
MPSLCLRKPRADSACFRRHLFQRSAEHLKEWSAQGDDVWSPRLEETDALAELVSQAG